MDKAFKICSCCGKQWADQGLFIKDKELNLIGYKADFEKLEYGLFFFNHKRPECESTITIEALNFMNLYNGPIFSERKFGTVECPGLCQKQDQLGRCDARCECAFVREIINIIKELNGMAKKS